MPMTKPTSEQVTFLAAGAGASQRTVLDKLRDVVSVKDFGAVGNGVTDDTTAFTNAIAAAGTRDIFVPGATYVITGTLTGNFYTDSTVTISGGTVNTINRIGSTLSTTGNATIGGNLTVNGNLIGNETITGDLEVSGGDITTTSTGTATVFNAAATTVNIGGAATAMAVGSQSAGTVSVNNLSMNAGYGSVAPVFGCRAWVNFDGTRDTTGAVSAANTNRLIRGSGNVASVLRNGVGDYTITFTTAMPDANYVVIGMGMLNRRVQYQSATFGSGIQNTGACAIRNTDSATTVQDDQCINIVMFR